MRSVEHEIYVHIHKIKVNIAGLYKKIEVFVFLISSFLKSVPIIRV